MRKYRKLSEKINRQFENIISKSEEVNRNMEEFVEINNSILDNFENLDKIVEDIDKEFAEKTGILNKKDQIFLWTAVALQVLRIYIIINWICYRRKTWKNFKKSSKGKNI